MEPLSILLIGLAAVGIWAIVELVFLLRKVRTTLSELNETAHSATAALDQATPLIDKLDGMVDDLQPAVREVTPILEKVTVTVDEANESLNKVNSILGDVSSATHGVAGVGESASRIVNTATSAAVGVVSKVASFGGITIPEGQQLIGKGSSDTEADEAEEQVVQAAAEETHAHKSHHKSGYVTYAPVSSTNDEE